MADKQDGLTQEEADQLEAKMREMAEAWRKRLSDPATKSLIAAGSLTISPLVQKLLDMYLPAPKK